MNAVIPAFLQVADTWGASIGRASLVACIAIAAAWAIARWCTSLSPRVVCWIWRLACLKVLLALVWIQPVDIALLPARAESIAAPVFTALTGSTHNSQGELQVSFAPPPDPRAHAETGRSFSALAGLLLAAWLIGVACCIARTARQWRSVRRLRSSSAPCASDRMLSLCREEGQRLGVRRLPLLRLSRHVESPLLVGLWRPTIILPDGAEENFDETGLRLMIAHELAHLRRHDLDWNWLPTLAAWLFFFHPLVWVMIRRWAEAQEAACDEMLIQRQVAAPADYGRLLVKLSACSRLESRAGLAAAGVLGAYRNLERRILAMTRVKPFSARRLTLAATTLSLAAIAAIVPWRLVAAEPKPDAVAFNKYMATRRAPPEITGTFVRNRLEEPITGVDPAADRAFARLREQGANPAGMQPGGLSIGMPQGGLSIGIQQGWTGTDADLELLRDLPNLGSLLLDFEHVSADAVGKLKLKPKQPLQALVLSGLSDERLTALGSLPGCIRIILPENTLTAKGFGELARLADGVEFLIPALAGGVDDEKLAAIGKIRSLKVLQLQQAEITDAGLAHLAGLDRLEELMLFGCTRIDGAGFARLGPIKSLRTLKATNMPIDAEGFRALATLTQLTELELWPDALPSAGGKPADVGALKSLANLESLKITADPDEPSPVAVGDAVLSTAAQMPALRRLRVVGLATSAAGLAALARLPHLEELSLAPCKLSDPTLAALAQLKGLKKLELMSSGTLTQSAWEKLGQIKPFAGLWVSNSGVDDAGLKQLAGLSGLWCLDLRGSKITGSGLESLANLKQLSRLDLSDSPLGDEGGQLLSNFPAIETLHLSKTRITDRSLDAIAALPNLRTVNLDGTSVTAEGLMKLRNLKQLGRISVLGIKASAEEMDRLRAAMPEVMISEQSFTGDLWGPTSMAGRGNLDESFALLEKAHEEQPSPAVYRAAVQTLRVNFDKATDAQKELVEQWLAAAIQADPDSSELKFILADFREMEGRFDDSIQLYRDLLARPDLKEQRRAVIQNNLAYLLVTHGAEKDLAEARALIDDAVKQLGPIGGVLDTRGLIHLAQGDAKAAMADFKAAVAPAPTAINYFHLALAEEKGGDAASAAEAFEMAETLKLDLKLLSPSEQRAYQRLKEAAAKRAKP